MFIEKGIIRPNAVSEPTCFGKTVLINSNGSLLMVGSVNSPLADRDSSGRLYCYNRDGDIWKEIQDITADESIFKKHYCYSIAINDNDDRLFVSSPYPSMYVYRQYGRVYIYSKIDGKWILSDTVTSGDIDEFTGYGVSISTNDSGSILVIGAPDIVACRECVGSVYVYKDNAGTWTKIDKLVPRDNYSDSYGSAVSISGNGEVIIVGEYSNIYDDLVKVGRIFIYYRNNDTWMFDRIMTASDSMSHSRYGMSIAINHEGNILAVGSPTANIGSLDDAGKVYIYIRNNDTWRESQILSASDMSPYAQYGRTLAMSSDGSILAVGAYMANSDGVERAGQVYIYARSGNTWIEQQILSADDKCIDGWYGASMSISRTGSVLVIGSLCAPTNTVSISGKVYLYENL